MYSWSPSWALKLWLDISKGIYLLKRQALALILAISKKIQKMMFYGTSNLSALT